ncbi:hypothetical protein T4D_3288 [Trichinella pseudospiralis]|uniref:Uncharacterized protein n=1 Tax=Trichinella pseudospiralis TaxID=6337 RepID=A0A0V1FGX2_TRIPS|nr:hypothetical protein T4D_3288 [Trichinella pseudospiralis]
MSEGYVEDIELTNGETLYAIGEIRKRIFDVILANLYRRGKNECTDFVGIFNRRENRFKFKSPEDNNN